MSKTFKQKETAVDSLTGGLKNAKGVVFANFQGLKVSDFETLRHSCREKGVTVLVAKKTLVKRAYQDANLGEIDSKNFSGGVATFMGNNDEISAAKIVNDFAKTNEIVKIFGGVLEGKFISAAEVKNLASLPTKEELLSKLVGTLNAPVSGFVNVLAGNLRNFVSVLNNIKEAKA